MVSRAPAQAALPASSTRCAQSIRLSHDAGVGWFAVWWNLRGDSSADLVVSRSPDGITWNVPVRVDTTDVGRSGCRRPPPSIASDAGNVHVAYAMAAREGPGIFASHSMDHGVIFHSPVTVVYGERIGRTAIAAHGDLVAVAYEDPNTSPQRIGLAFSRSMGHVFEDREVISPATGEAREPGVALAPGRIAVVWTRGDSADTTASRVIRVGAIR